VYQKHSNLLWELRSAMDEAFGTSERVIAAIVAIHQAGQGVRIEIDATVLDGAVTLARESAREAHLDSGGVLVLDANDMLFLRDLRIRVETDEASSD
jgi:hypothetical protein